MVQVRLKWRPTNLNTYLANQPFLQTLENTLNNNNYKY